MTRVTIAVAGAAIVLSIFFAFVGVPYTQASIRASCSVAAGCTQGPTTVTSGFTPTAWALVPLASGVMVVFGLIAARKVISWTGTVLLAVFSAVSLFSIGLLYVPFVPLLVGLLAGMPLASKSQP